MNEEKQQKSRYLVIPHYRTLLYFSFGTILSWIAWIIVIRELDPYANSNYALPLFFFTTFVSLTGTFTILLSLIKKWKSRDQLYLKHVIISMRQGALLSLCTTVCLGLLMLGFLRIWNGLLLVTLMMLIEFYFSGKDEL